MNIAKLAITLLPVMPLFLGPIAAAADDRYSPSRILLAAKDSLDGPPPCGQDGVCNLAACSSDPDCPDGLPTGGSSSSSGPQPSRPGDIKDCTAREEDEIGLAADWVADNWSEFEAALEDIRGWPVNIKNCLKNRFAKNGKVVCEQSDRGRCSNASAWASPFNKKSHFCPNWLNVVSGVSGVENRQGCYIVNLTHEWAHTCERSHKTIEIFDNEAFEFWKSEHSGSVTINIGDCDLD